MIESVFVQTIVAYHGCDIETAETLVTGEIPHLSPSENPYDWLGDGMYFFEDDLLRALRFAQTSAANPEKRLTANPITVPLVVGAGIRLGNCLDPSKQAGIGAYRNAYDLLVESMESGFEMPVNKPASPDDTEIILRHLDRAVINFIHGQRIEEGLAPYDTVRGFFFQRDRVVPTSAIGTLSHVQIVVRNTACNLGYFQPATSTEDAFQGLQKIPPKPYRKKRQAS